MSEARVFFILFVLFLCLLVVQDRSLNMDCSTDDDAEVKCPHIAGQPKPKKLHDLNHAILKRNLTNFSL